MNYFFSSKNFLISFFIFSLFSSICIMLINIYIDVYGIFGESKNKKLPVYYNERISKYLLSYKYIPINYNTIIAGPSLSDNINITQCDSSLKIYNISIMGGNISETKILTIHCIDQGIKNVILCLNPYQFKDVGEKEIEFNDKIYFSALGSLDLYQTYLVAIIRHLELLPSKYPKNQINENGVNNYEKLFEVNNVKEKIKDEVKIRQLEKYFINPKAMQEFKELIVYLQKKEIQFLIYFHPIPLEILKADYNSVMQFQNKICNIVGDSSRILDFNQPKYHQFTANYDNYIDHGHLSKSGCEEITLKISQRINELFL